MYLTAVVYFTLFAIHYKNFCDTVKNLRWHLSGPVDINIDLLQGGVTIVDVMTPNDAWLAKVRLNSLLDEYEYFKRLQYRARVR